MSETRPSGFAIVPANVARVSQEVASIDHRGRLRILPRWVERLNWLSSAGDRSALLTLLEPGRLSISSWLDNSPRILETYNRLSQSDDADDLEAIRLLQDRYGRLPVPLDLRPHLGDAAILHLGMGLERDNPSPVYVAIFPEALHVLSTAYRDKLLQRASIALDL